MLRWIAPALWPGRLQAAAAAAAAITDVKSTRAPLEMHHTPQSASWQAVGGQDICMACWLHVQCRYKLWRNINAVETYERVEQSRVRQVSQSAAPYCMRCGC